MLFKTLSAAVYGIDASLIEVEVDVSGIKLGEDRFTTVGLPDTAVRESRDRVRSALKNCGYDVPPTHITVNLAPADIKKEGSGFDLPMAIGILGAYGALQKRELADWVLVGELSLDGSLRGVRGALPIAVAARAHQIRNLIVPEANAREAAVVSNLNVYPVRSLMEVVRLINSGDGIAPARSGYRFRPRRLPAVHRRFQGRPGPAHRQARPGGRLRRRPQHPDDRSSGLRQDHVGQAHSHHPAAFDLRRGAGNHQNP